MEDGPWSWHFRSSKRLMSTTRKNSRTSEPMNSKRILLVAGEVSGDLHGSHLVEALQRIEPGIQFFGVGGEGLERRGMKLLYPAHSLSVVGITEVFVRL